MISLLQVLILQKSIDPLVDGSKDEKKRKNFHQQMRLQLCIQPREKRWQITVVITFSLMTENYSQRITIQRVIASAFVGHGTIPVRVFFLDKSRFDISLPLGIVKLETKEMESNLSGSYLHDSRD